MNDEAEAPGVAFEAAHGQRAGHVGQRAGVGANAAGLDLDRRRADRGASDEVSIVPGMGGEDVKIGCGFRCYDHRSRGALRAFPAEARAGTDA
jgi:hypothetical protein